MFARMENLRRNLRHFIDNVRIFTAYRRAEYDVLVALNRVYAIYFKDKTESILSIDREKFKHLVTDAKNYFKHTVAGIFYLFISEYSVQENFTIEKQIFNNLIH